MSCPSVNMAPIMTMKCGWKYDYVMYVFKPLQMLVTVSNSISKTLEAQNHQSDADCRSKLKNMNFFIAYYNIVFLYDCSNSRSPGCPRPSIAVQMPNCGLKQ